MPNDKELHRLFKSNKIEIPDNGFSDEVMHKLPERASILPHLIIILCAVLGFYLTIGIVGIDSLVEQLNNFSESLNKMEMPSSSIIVSYITGLVLLGTVSYAIYEVDDEFS